MKTNSKILFVLLTFLATSTYAQKASCSACSNFNCAFDGITGSCRVTCGVNYNYSVAGTLSQAPVITGGTLVSHGGSSFTVNWTCGGSGGAMEVRYTNNGRNYITEGQVCICSEPTGGPSNYCENINLNCAMDGITGPCNLLVGASANYSVSVTGTIVWIITINGSPTQLSGNPISFQWPGPGPCLAEIEVLRNGAHFTEGMVCVDTN
jgi:hypothetical protein